MDDKFSFGFVFKGKYQVHLRGPGKTGPRLAREGEEIIGLELGGAEYWAEVDEDEAAEEAAMAGKKKTTFNASSDGWEGGMRMVTGDSSGDGFGGEDNASCSCIEGNPCVSAYNCKNWDNRFEIAKANGWKGYA